MDDRIIKLIGKDNLDVIKSKHILLIGVGGVGSAALETLVRNGFQNIEIIDYDKVEESNLNRQIITDTSNIGELKVNAAYKRMKLINPDINLSCQAIKLTEDNLVTILDSGFDYVIDACDDINIKYELIRLSCKMDFKLIESMGTAKKIDPTKLCITYLDKTTYDPIAKILRKKLRDNKINKRVVVVSSTETIKECDGLGTLSLVPNTAGILLVSYIINDILKENM